MCQKHRPRRLFRSDADAHSGTSSFVSCTLKVHTLNVDAQKFLALGSSQASRTRFVRPFHPVLAKATGYAKPTSPFYRVPREGVTEQRYVRPKSATHLFSFQSRAPVPWSPIETARFGRNRMMQLPWIPHLARWGIRFGGLEKNLRASSTLTSPDPTEPLTTRHRCRALMS